MTISEWWRGAVVYQIYPRSFFDGNGDGIGDLPGVAARLDHVAGLGADAIWLCPFFVSPQRDFGYDVADYQAVDPIFGTLADFDAVVGRAHDLGLKVLIDQVWSHTSDQHPWFLDSRRGRDGDRAGWYVWADPNSDGTPPNNWLSVFGGSAWTWEPRRRQYYLHHFLTQQPALNLHNPAVMDALMQTGRFWLDRGVDGFRLDAIDFLLHDKRLRPNPAAPRPAAVPAKLFGMQLHVHDMLQPEALGLLARIRGLTDQYPGSCTLGEVSSQPGAFGRVATASSGNRYLHMAYTLAPLRGGFDRAAVLGWIEESARPDGWICWSFSNHDAERAASRWGGGPAFARMQMALLLSLRGSVCLYQGEELGLPEAELAEKDLRDPFGIAYWPAFRGRDGSRTPMPWVSAAAHAGFTTAMNPWLPVPEAHRALAVDRQDDDPGSLLHAYRRFLRWRRDVPALLLGSLTPLHLPDPLVGFVREHGDQRIAAVFNLSGHKVTDIDLPTGPSLSESGFDGQHDVIEPYGVRFIAMPSTVPAVS